MNKTKIKVRHADSFLEQLSDRFDRIRRRAFELFERRGAGSPDLALEDWLAAERELALQPPVELSETEEGFEVEAALPGMDPDDVVVEATNEDVLISAERKSRHKDNAHGKTETMVRMF